MEHNNKPEIPPVLTTTIHERSDALNNFAMALQELTVEDHCFGISQVRLYRDSKRPDVYPEHLRNNSSDLKSNDNYNSKFLRNWLKQIKIKLASCEPSLTADIYLLGTVHFLADHYSDLKEFYQNLKSHQHLKRNFMAKAPKKKSEYILDRCAQLKENELIDEFAFLQDKRITVDVSEIHQSTKFINGYWLELLLRSKLAGFIKQFLHKIQKFDILSQVSIIKPDQTENELDLLLRIKQKDYWFECKNGSISDSYRKFSDHRKLLGLNSDHSFVVMPVNDPTIARHFSKKSEMTLMGSNDLIDHLLLYI